MATKPRKKRTSSSTPVTPISGYRRAPRYEWIEYRPDDFPEDAEPLRCEIRTNLSMDEIESIPFGLKKRYDEILPAIAPHVTGWNLVRENLETGLPETVPAPADAGPDVLKLLTDDEALWLIMAIKFRFRQQVESDEGKGDSSPSESGPEANGEPS